MLIYCVLRPNPAIYREGELTYVLQGLCMYRKYNVATETFFLHKHCYIFHEYSNYVCTLIRCEYLYIHTFSLPHHFSSFASTVCIVQDMTDSFPSKQAKMYTMNYNVRLTCYTTAEKFIKYRYVCILINLVSYLHTKKIPDSWYVTCIFNNRNRHRHRHRRHGAER